MSEAPSPAKFVGIAAGLGALAAGAAFALSSTEEGGKPAKSYAAKHVTVFVSGAAGQIAYSLLPLLCSGHVFGPNTQVSLNLLDITPAMQVLSGVMMELEDGAYPLLRAVQITDKAEEALKGADVAIFTGGMPRKQGMERKDLISANCKIFAEQGKAMEKVASKACKVLVVANPANTNCFILRANAPSIPTENFTCLTRLDLNRAMTQVAIKAKCKVSDIQNVVIWGNHSSTQYPDVESATIRVKGEFKPAPKVLDDEAWIQGPFISTVQQRGKAVIDARKLSSAMSAANAIADHIRTWLVTGTEPGCTVSMGVVSDGSYGIQKGLVFSYPLHIDIPGQYRIAQGFHISEFAKKMLKTTEEELKAERIDAEAALKGA